MRRVGKGLARPSLPSLWRARALLQPLLVGVFHGFSSASAQKLSSLLAISQQFAYYHYDKGCMSALTWGHGLHYTTCEQQQPSRPSPSSPSYVQASYSEGPSCRRLPRSPRNPSAPYTRSPSSRPCCSEVMFQLCAFQLASPLSRLSAALPEGGCPLFLQRQENPDGGGMRGEGSS